MGNIITREKLASCASQFFYSSLEKCEDFDKYINTVDKELNRLKIDVVRANIEEFDNQLRKYIPSNWKIVKRLPRKIICMFGAVEFVRTKFTDEYGRNRYLCDELLGIPYKSRISNDVAKWLLYSVSRTSFGQTVKDFKKINGVNLSAMTVWFLVQRQANYLELKERDYGEMPFSQQSICTESDGIFVALQSPHRRKKQIKRFFADQQRIKRSIEIKVGCIYAGKKDVGNLKKRANVNLIGGIYTTREFWNRFNQKIKSDYDLEDLEKIYYASDCGAWCKNHDLEALSGKIKVKQTIDKYHIMQYLWAAFPEGDSNDWLVNLVLRGRPEAILNVLDKILLKVHGARRKKILTLYKYIEKNQEFLRSRFNLGTMEATNAYVWAKRMKRFGCAWTVRGAHAMAILLARIYSNKPLVGQPKNVFFTKIDNEKEEKVLEKWSAKAVNYYRFGDGYNAPSGHIHRAYELKRYAQGDRAIYLE